MPSIAMKLPALCLLACASAAADAYDPLALPSSAEVQTVDLTVQDAARQREIPVRVYLPAPGSPAPTVLFSHGLGGTRTGCEYLGRHWAGRGYAAVFLQHPGSDDAVWRNEALPARMAAMNRAASAENFLLRVQDVPAVVDQLKTWHEQPGHALAGRCDLTRVGMSGHSFGAVTTQAVSGQATLGSPRFTDARIRAAIALSPSSPRRGDPQRAFGRVSIPWLLMTGTEDTSPIGGQTLESRLAVFPALPPGNKYELVLHGGQHSAFTDHPLPGERSARNPQHHRAILAISTAFWDAFLRSDDAAQAWLNGPGPRSVLPPEDKWQTK